MSSIWEAAERDRITVKIHNMRRSVSRDSPLRSKRRPGSMGRYDDSSDERMSPDRLRRRVARTPSPRRPPSPRIRYISPHREEYVRVPREPVYESRSKYEYKRSISPEYKRPYYGAAPVPDHRRVPSDMYERYGGPPPHVMHHPREFRPPMHHESVYVPRGPPMYYAHRPPYQHYVPRHSVPRHPVAENKIKENKFPNYLHHVQPEEDPLATRTLFAGNLEINISEEELRRIFAKYGTLEDIDIKRPPPDSGNAFAFVRFHNLDMAHRAKVELSGQYIGKLQCKIGYAKVKPTSRIWVGGLGSWTSHTQLEREFDRFGVIKKIEYQKGDIQAYILYESIEAAQAAVNEMRGFALGGPDRRLRTDFFDPNPPSTTTTFKPKTPGSTDYYYHEPHHYEESGYYPPYVSRGGYRGRGRGRGSFRGAYAGHESHRPPPPEEEWRRSAAEVDYESRPPRHAISREPGVERSRSRSPIRRRSPDSDSDSSSRRNGMLSAARTLPEVARKCTTSWNGALVLKNSLYPAKFHLTDGDADIVDGLMKDEDGKPHLRITQRLRLDMPKLDDVQKRISTSSSHAIFLGLAGSTQTVQIDDVGLQTRPLFNLVTYLKGKEAAGVVSLLNKETEATGVLYAFPPCEFSSELLKRTCHNMTEDGLKEDHLVVVVVRGGTA